MDADQAHQEIQQYADNVLEYLKQSSKNIEWSMEIQIVGWDCQIKIRGIYLDCQSWIHSPSIFIGDIIEGHQCLPDGFDDYVLHATIRNLSKELFER